MNDFRFIHVAVGLAIMGVFFVMIVLYAREIYWINNTWNIIELVLYTALALVVASQFLVLIFAWKVKGLARVQVHIGVAMFMLIISPLVGSLTNRMLGEDKETVKRTAEVVEIKPYSTSLFGIPKDVEFETEGYHLVVTMEGFERHFKIRENPYGKKEPGAEISIPFKIGYWGYEYVDL